MHRRRLIFGAVAAGAMLAVGLTGWPLLSVAAGALLVLGVLLTAWPPYNALSHYYEYLREAERIERDPSEGDMARIDAIVRDGWHRAATSFNARDMRVMLGGVLCLAAGSLVDLGLRLGAWLG